MVKWAAAIVLGWSAMTFGQENTSAPASTSAASAPAQAKLPVRDGKPIQTDILPGETIQYPSTNRDVSAYLVKPKVDGPAPAVLLVHDIFGMTAFAKKQADSLARQGYVVLMPNLYSRVDGAEQGLDAQKAWVAYEATSDAQINADLLAAIEFLEGENAVGKITAAQPLGVVGHDMGGIFAMKLAGADLRVTAAVNYYGRILYANTSPKRPISPVEDLFNLRAPLLSFYGAVDPQVPRDQVRALERRLQNNPQKTYYELVRLPNVGHGFLVPGRQGYNAQAAQQAEERTRDFLARYLRGEPKKLEE